MAGAKDRIHFPNSCTVLYCTALHCTVLYLTAGPKPVHGFTLVENYDYEGRDMDTYCAVKTPTLEACASLCAKTPYCKVFMYRGAGCSLPIANPCCQGCWLKHEFPMGTVGRYYPPEAKVVTGIMPGKASGSVACAYLAAWLMSYKGSPERRSLISTRPPLHMCSTDGKSSATHSSWL